MLNGNNNVVKRVSREENFDTFGVVDVVASSDVVDNVDSSGVVDVDLFGVVDVVDSFGVVKGVGFLSGSGISKQQRLSKQIYIFQAL
uniref:Uncharacterized protein n=1 Tax=Amphimedon queenslandica TaxID=400682 RepID=A0A1X7T1R7_AMPQE